MDKKNAAANEIFQIYNDYVFGIFYRVGRFCPCGGRLL